MAGFMVRIQLKEATTGPKPDYDALHAKMESAGFARLVTDETGRTFDLTSATYSADLSFTNSLDVSKYITLDLDKNFKDYAILVVKTEDIAGRLKIRNVYRTLSSDKKFF